MKSFRALLYKWLRLGFGVALAAGVTAVQALPSELARPVAPPVIQQSGCSETEVAQAPWIHWAMHARNVCAAESANQGELTACLLMAKDALVSLEREYEQIYRSEVRTLPLDHPVVQAILMNLKRKANAAAQVIEQGYVTAQRSALTPLSCQNQN